MEYKFKHLEVDGTKIVEAKAFGIWQQEEFDSVVDEFASYFNESDCNKVFVDYRELIFQASVSDIYQRPRIFFDILKTRNVVMAILVKSISKNLIFLETVYLNESIPVKLFTDYKEAMNWLIAY